MSDFMRLELGAQSRAANLVARGIQDVMLPVDNLARVVGESAQGPVRDFMRARSLALSVRRQPLGLQR